MNLCLQAGMIRMGHEEFFIEPLNQRSTAVGEEEEEEEGRKHVVYRSTAVIKKPPVNQSIDDFHRGENTKAQRKLL